MTFFSIYDAFLRQYEIKCRLISFKFFEDITLNIVIVNLLKYCFNFYKIFDT